MASVARRYARAFAEVVMERRIAPDKAVEELRTMAELWKSSVDLRNVLMNPAVEHSQKLRLLDSIVKLMGAGKELRNFVAVLIDHRRVRQLDEIAVEFKNELNERLGIAEAQVNSVRELTREEKQLLEKQIAALTGKVVRTTYSQDVALLGGAVVRIGSTIYDGSVRGQLRKVREQIAAS
jgi:F-type H+-transporting ATPase subunit delta